MGLTQKLGTIPLAIQTDSSNNVGIGGAVDASYKLKVTGATLTTGAATFSSSVNINGETLTIGGTSNNAIINNIASIRLNIDSDNTGTGESFTIGHNQTAINDSNVLFRVQDNGNVGIGTSSPATKFDLAGTIGNFQIASSGAEVFLTRNDNNDILATGGTSSGITIGAQSYVRFSSGSSYTERMRITSGGNVLFQKTASNNTDTGAGWFLNDYFGATNNSADSGDRVVLINRQNSDGTLIDFRHANVSEGSISVSGTTVSYNGGHLSRYSQTELNEKIEGLLKGTVMSNLDKMAVWINPETKEPYENEQLNCMKISDVEGDKNVAGVFVNWEYDSELLTNDMNIAMTGDMIIRIAQGVVVEKGQLLMSAGDGTAKPQEDDIIRSKTVAKVTSNHITCTYEDGSYCVPCVLMAC